MKLTKISSFYLCFVSVNRTHTFLSHFLKSVSDTDANQSDRKYTMKIYSLFCSNLAYKLKLKPNMYCTENEIQNSGMTNVD